MNPKNLTNEDLAKLTKAIENDWEIDPVNKIIRRKKTSNWSKFLELIGFKRKTYPLQVLYRFTKEFFFRSDNMPFQFPFNNPEIRGIYKITNGYRIPISDRKFLTHGPLYHQDGETILIPESRTFLLDKRWFRILLTIIILTSAVLSIYSKLKN